MTIFSKKRTVFLNSIQIGDIYGTKVEEIIADGDAIVNFRGNFIRVKNKSSIKVGEYLTVKVTHVYPELIFEILRGLTNIDHKAISHSDKIQSKKYC